MPMSPVANGVRAIANPTPRRRMRMAARVWFESIEGTMLSGVEDGEAFTRDSDPWSEHRIGLTPRPDHRCVLRRGAVRLSGEVERPCGELMQLRARRIVR